MTMNQLQDRWQAHQSARSEYEAQSAKTPSLSDRIRATIAREPEVRFSAPAARAA